MHLGHLFCVVETSGVWPKEANRKLVEALATLHFAPTEVARDNLVKELSRPRLCL